MNRHRAGSKALIREINEALVLDVVRVRGPVSRAEITSRSGLSAATVTGITGHLIAGGYLVEADVVRGTGGRPARLLALSADGLVVAGVRVGPSEVIAVLVNLRGDVVNTVRERLRSRGVDAVAGATGRAVAALVADGHEGGLLGVGVAVSGVVDQRAGRVLHSGAMGWQDVPLRAVLGRHVDAPVVIDSFANAVAMDLLLFDSELDGQDLLVFSIGVSLGASVVLGGRVHRGASGSAGGFAHSRVDEGGLPPRPCHCGGSGCLETWSSVWGIDRELTRRALPTDSDGWDAPEQADVVREAGARIGVAMANASKLVGSERVVVACAEQLDRPTFLGPMTGAFDDQYLHGETARPDLHLVAAEPAGLARGAGYVVLAQLFSTDQEQQVVVGT